jgi:phosphohistidine phosphatase
LVKRLYVLRHAKSSWDDPGVADHARPLAGRGRRAAKAVARHLRDRGVQPDLVLCSPARRARETLKRIEPALGQVAVEFDGGIYGASAGELIERLRALPDDVGSVLLIGHNPGLQDLIVAVAHPSRAAREVEATYPTAALATLEFSGESWRALGADTAELVELTRPRDLPAP